MYAHGTKVEVNTSRGDIERLLMKRGATGFGFIHNNSNAMLIFEMQGRRLRFIVPMPGPDTRPRLSDSQIKAETKRRWRALLLVLKAKLEAIDSKITTLDQEFLAHIVVEGTSTIGDRILPEIKSVLADANHKLPPLLGPG